MKKFFWSFFLIFTIIKCTAQDIKYAQKTLTKLSSKSLWGRGYTKNGMTKAADFIIHELKKNDVAPMSNNTFKQYFYYPVNTFNGNMKVKINRQKLIAGKDFIINNNSRGIHKKCFVHQIDSVNLEAINYPIKIKLTDKLTWSVATDTADYTEIIIKKTALKSTIKELDVNIDNTFIPNFKAANICGLIKGSQKPDSIILITAHYDHLGGMGAKTYFPGANDNASGVSILLNLAKYYAQNPPPYSIGFICFAGEEAGLLGSKYFTENPLIDLKSIRFLINLDLVGTGEKGITIVNAKELPNEFNALLNIDKAQQLFSKITARSNAANSDHYFFSKKGVPSFFIYTQGDIAAYHDIDDKAETLPLTKYNELFKLITSFNRYLMN